MAEGKFIDLKTKDGGVSIARPTRKERGEMIYVSGKDLPISDGDLDKEKEVKVKLIPRQKRTTIENGQSRSSYDLEIVGIKF